MRPIPAPARVIRTALSLRAAGFVRPPREGRILAGSQRVPCPPRHPARRPPPGFARPPREGRILAASQRVPYPPPAASPCARVRIHCAVLSLPAAGSVCRVALRAPVIACAPREGRILAASQRVPARRVALRAHPHPLRSPIPACRRFFPALRGKGGYWQRASACPVRRPPRRPARASASTAQSYPCLPPVLCAASPCARPPAFPVRPNPARPHFQRSPTPARRPPPGFVRPRLVRSAARVPRAAYPCAPRVLPASSFACAPREGRILAGSQRVPCPPPAASPCARPRSLCSLTQRAAGSVRRVALRARPHPLRSPIPA